MTPVYPITHDRWYTLARTPAVEFFQTRTRELAPQRPAESGKTWGKLVVNPETPRIASIFLDAAAQLATAAACFRTARQVRGTERRRRFARLAAGGVLVANLATAATFLAGGFLTGRMSPSYAIFLVLYGVALAGLLSLPTAPVEGQGENTRTARHSGYRWHTITLLDCVLIVGSIILLAWGTTLAALVPAGPPDPIQLLAALLHPVASLILATAVLLITCFRRPRSPAASVLLSTGLLIDGLTSNISVYSTAPDSHHLPPWAMIGFTLAFMMIFLAALLPARTHPDNPTPDSLTTDSLTTDSLTPGGPRAVWAHAVLPYAVLGAAGLLILGKLSTGAQLDRFEAYGMVGLLLVALVRQMVTLAESNRLLAEVRQRARQLHHQAFHDPLTGLANRALFTRRLQRALTHDPDNPDNPDACHAGDSGTVSVLFLDLDGFKLVNDTLGHAAGDELLKISAERLRADTRAVDTVARLGGDEFAIILGSGGVDARKVGERLAMAVQEPCLLAGQIYTPRASFGLVTLDGSTTRPASPDSLLHQADLAMYAAKRERAGRLVVYRPELSALPEHRHPDPPSQDDPVGAYGRVVGLM
ncbi:GGDEF domain-containing protein [Frankia casuarinae]|uniref:Diguanylate cyclase (GGDEF domain) n=1 Tax=Frankia casuarinae (strain DSM 45818 / CECT 9043 / HFP020203 / CcI3) TaxID=106370 RepID=Q2JCK3_FRACC|nr:MULTISPECIES: GGDEF domain-containing protein [Frankia]ABD10989.1 diguanylate cyclase (GGDEF domain) [Frankia casuarinae]ETA02158.1 GGDEF domain-containing protein [Frankia sp. CcI6]EYT91389.1 GGDEF domain-containing protein [Frankia casuarinae]KDA42841.1 GGDEF domain-containing protein [Frankia sp. BMG5.23]OAA28918.1 diguanylate cyclase (GGDEF) domain-containing protein [Frankia casuarinae]